MPHPLPLARGLCLLLSSLAFVVGVEMHTWDIANSCPDEITVYHRSLDMVTLPAGAIYSTEMPNVESPGVIFTNYNNGTFDMTKSMRFTTWSDAEETKNTYYYLVKGDVFNAGFSVEPIGGTPPSSDFCPKIICDSADCATAFEGPQYEFPPFGSEAPATPLYSCPGENIHFKITFCPNGQFPNPVAERYISANSHEDKCLDVQGGVWENGTTVNVNTCSESSKTQKWVIDRGVTKVRIAGTNFCIDRGEPGYNTGVESTITQCNKDSQTQKWRYSDITNHIWWYGTAHSWDRPGICIDLINADTDQVQISNCTNGVDSQVWKVAALDGTS